MTTATTAEMVAERPRKPRAAIALMVAVLVANAVQAVRVFPTPGALVDDAHPVILVDHAIHLYHGALGSRSLREHGAVWGYDPFFMAGYPVTPVWDSSSNLSILFQGLAGGGYHPGAYNVGLLACSILAVACLPASAALAGLRTSEAALAALVGWLYVRCGWPDMFFRSGLFSFVTASCGIVFLIGVLLGFERRPSAVRWGLLAGTSAALLFSHVTAPVLAVGAALGFASTAAWRHSWRFAAAVVAAALLALVANLFWIVPLLRFRGIRAPRAFFMAPPSGWLFVEQYRIGDLEAHLTLAILILGVAGLLAWLVEGHGVRVATFGGAALVCLLLALFGGMWGPTRTLEPFRFKVPFHLILGVPAGSAIVRGSARLASALGGRRRGALGVASGWLIALVAAGLTWPQSVRVLGRQLAVDRPLVAGLRPEMSRLVRWLRENTDPSARILFEDQLRLYESTDPESTHWTPLLPMLLGSEARQFIGGLYQSAFIAHHKLASFGDFHLGGVAIDAWSPEALQAYCQYYNIGWVVAWSPLSRLCFDQWAQAHRVATLPRYHTPGRASVPPNEWRGLVARGGVPLAEQYAREGEGQYVIYRLDRPRSFFLQGQGRIAGVDLNRIELADVVPQQGKLLLSLHWTDQWRSDPPVRIEPFPIPDDPVPFVGISTAQPLKRLTLSNSYGR